MTEEHGVTRALQGQSRRLDIVRVPVRPARSRRGEEDGRYLDGAAQRQVPQGGLKLCRRLFLHVRQHVAARVERDAHRRVTQSLAYDLSVERQRAAVAFVFAGSLPTVAEWAQLGAPHAWTTLADVRLQKAEVSDV